MSTLKESETKNLNEKSILVYTDGSCNPSTGIGGWAALVFLGNEKIVLSGCVANTTHQRMELQAALQSFEYLERSNLQSESILLYTDSQYVVGISGRMGKMKKANFTTSKNLPIRNQDLVQNLIRYIEMMKIHFVKVKAHEKNSSANSNLNREVDKLARQIVRQASK